MNIENRTRQAVLINAATILLASIVLLLLRAMNRGDQFEALVLSVLFGAVACLTVIIRRDGQGQIALGAYLLVIGGATIILPRLLIPSYGQDDPDFLFLLLGPIYTIAGSVLVVVSLISHRYWMESMHSMLVRTLLLAAPAILLTLLWPLAFGPRMWDTPPYGFDLTAFSWIVGIGLFFAGSRFAPKGQPHPAQLM